MIGALVLLLAWEQIHPFYNFFNRSVKRKGRHDLRNLFVGLVNALLVSLVFVSLWAMGSDWSHEERFGLFHRFEMGTAFHFVLAVLLLDLWMYIWHRMNHEISFFWRFHRVHHSDPNMDVTTATRFHVGEIFFSSLFRIPLIILLGIWVGELLLYETIAFTVVQLHHSNVGLPPKLDRMVRGVIVSPFMHKIHHSRWRPETDSNYGSLFSFWDRIARTFRMRNLEDFKSLRIGLDEFDDPEYETVKNIFRLPVLKIRRDPVEDDEKKQ